MIHWVINYNTHGAHKAQCGEKVTTEEIASQYFEGVLRFLGRADKALEDNKIDCPKKYCEKCWKLALEKSLGLPVVNKKEKKSKKKKKD